MLSRSSCGTDSYKGSTTRQPISRTRIAWGSDPATSARPPEAAKGSASLVAYKTFMVSSYSAARRRHRQSACLPPLLYTADPLPI